MHSITSEKKSILWISLVKILACFMIFTHHFIKQYVEDFTYSMAVVAVSMFLFVSGYLSRCEINPHKWFYNRLISIYIPYWMVFVPMVIMNILLAYKAKSSLSLAVSFLGGSLLLPDPLFVVGWFITFILGMYIVAYLANITARPFTLAVLFLLTLLFILCLPQFGSYFRVVIWGTAFFTGYFIKYMNWENLLNSEQKNKPKIAAYQKLNKVFFGISKYTYAYFLVHGPVLMFLKQSNILSPSIVFITGFALSIIFSMVLYYLSQKIILKLGRLF